MNRLNIRLVATDMDGTLLDSHKKLPLDFPLFVKEHHDDIRFVIASGRQYYALRRDLKSIAENLIFIAENGSLVFEKDKIIYQNVMTKKDVLLTLELLKHVPYATPLLCGFDSAYMTCTDDEEMHHATMYYERLCQVPSLEEVAGSKDIVKLAIYFRKQMAEKSKTYFDSLPSNLKAVVSGVSWIDVANMDANKGSALQAIMKRFGIQREEAMAFGDYFNDVELLQSVKYSYAMDNAHPYIKKICAYHTFSNDEDGVMKVLRKLYD